MLRGVAAVAVLVLAVAAGAAGRGLIDDDGAPSHRVQPSRDARAAAGPAAACDPVEVPYGVPGATLACLHLPRRLVPPGAVEARGWQVERTTLLVAWTLGKDGGYAVWRRHGTGWRRLRWSRTGLHDLPAVWLDDVTQDGRTDVLVEGVDGSGACGEREVLEIGAARVSPLFRRDGCEQISTLADGLLYDREPIGSCLVPGRTAHCYGGVRIRILGWSGRRVVVRRTVVRCSSRAVDPRRLCRRPS